MSGAIHFSQLRHYLPLSTFPRAQLVELAAGGARRGTRRSQPDLRSRRTNRSANPCTCWPARPARSPPAGVAAIIEAGTPSAAYPLNDGRFRVGDGLCGRGADVRAVRAGRPDGDLGSTGGRGASQRRPGDRILRSRHSAPLALQLFPGPAQHAGRAHRRTDAKLRAAGGAGAPGNGPPGRGIDASSTSSTAARRWRRARVRPTKASRSNWRSWARASALASRHWATTPVSAATVSMISDGMLHALAPRGLPAPADAAATNAAVRGRRPSS